MFGEINMQDDVTLTVVLIDESGSMFGVKDDTVGGCNSFIAKVREEQAGKKSHVSIYMFDTGNQSVTRHYGSRSLSSIPGPVDHGWREGGLSAQEVYARNIVRAKRENAPIETCKPLKLSEYNPHQGTPLYDAIGITLGRVAASAKELGATKVTVMIQTDGAENESRVYGHETVKGMIEARTKEGWQIIFLGADISNAVAIGRGLGVAASNAFFYNKASTETTFNTMAASTAAYRATGVTSLNLSADQVEALAKSTN